MKYSDYILCPHYNVMVHKDDVKLIANELIKTRIDSRYELERDRLEDMHGDKYFWAVQDLAFMALFSNIEEYRRLV